MATFHHLSKDEGLAASQAGPRISKLSRRDWFELALAGALILSALVMFATRK